MPEHGDAFVLDFSKFVELLVRFNLLAERELVVFAFALIDDKKVGAVDARKVRWLLTMMRLLNPSVVPEHQLMKCFLAYGLDTFDGFISRRTELGEQDLSDHGSSLVLRSRRGKMTLSDFFELSARFPCVLAPLFFMQDCYKEAFLGRRYWETKKRQFESVRRNIRRGHGGEDGVEVTAALLENEEAPTLMTMATEGDGAQGTSSTKSKAAIRAEKRRSLAKEKNSALSAT